jgi:hypothetical protein
MIIEKIGGRPAFFLCGISDDFDGVSDLRG